MRRGARRRRRCSSARTSSAPATASANRRTRAGRISDGRATAPRSSCRSGTTAGRTWSRGGSSPAGLTRNRPRFRVSASRPIREAEARRSLCHTSSCSRSREGRSYARRDESLRLDWRKPRMKEHARFPFAGRIAIALLLVAAACEAAAQSTYPVKPVRIIVPVTTGGPSDLVARILGDKLTAALGKPFIVENRAGASQSIGAALVAKAEPDGYTLLQAAANMAINPILMSDLPYDTVKDFVPVSLTHTTPYVFVVSAQQPLNTLAELLTHIRDNPGKVTYGTTGQRSEERRVG